MDITPEGLKTPEGKKRVTQAYEKTQHIDNKCYQLLSEMIANGGVCKKYQEKVKELLALRVRTNEEFLNAIAPCRRKPG